MSKMNNFTMDCAETLVEATDRELTFGAAMDIVTTFGDVKFWKNYCNLWSIIQDKLNEKR